MVAQLPPARICNDLLERAISALAESKLAQELVKSDKAAQARKAYAD
jgi:hypothetical protein